MNFCSEVGELWGGVFLQLRLRGWRPGALRGGTVEGMVGLVWIICQECLKKRTSAIKHGGVRCWWMWWCCFILGFGVDELVLILGQHTKLCQSPGSLELQPRYWERRGHWSIRKVKSLVFPVGNMRLAASMNWLPPRVVPACRLLKLPCVLPALRVHAPCTQCTETYWTWSKENSRRILILVA